MTGISVNANELIENVPELIFIVPAVIFGYLFYLTGDSAFLHIAAVWAISVSVVIGIKDSIEKPNPETLVFRLQVGLYLVYVLIGLSALFAALNNILPEAEEYHPLIWIHAVESAYAYPRIQALIEFFVELMSGPLAVNDPILLALFGIQLITYSILVVSIVVGIALHLFIAVGKDILSRISDHI